MTNRNKIKLPIITKITVLLMILMGVFLPSIYSVSMGSNFRITHMSVLSILYLPLAFCLYRRQKLAWYGSVALIILWILGSFFEWDIYHKQFIFFIQWIPLTIGCVPLILLLFARKKFLKVCEESNSHGIKAEDKKE